MGQVDITVNGQPFTATAGASLLDLVRSLGLEPERVEVEVDGQIVRRELWRDTPVKQGARVEIVHFV